MHVRGWIRQGNMSGFFRFVQSTNRSSSRLSTSLYCRAATCQSPRVRCLHDFLLFRSRALQLPQTECHRITRRKKNSLCIGPTGLPTRAAAKTKLTRHAPPDQKQSLIVKRPSPLAVIQVQEKTMSFSPCMEATHLRVHVDDHLVLRAITLNHLLHGFLISHAGSTLTMTITTLIEDVSNNCLPSGPVGMSDVVMTPRNKHRTSGRKKSAQKTL